MHLIGSHPFFDFANEEISAFSKSKSCAHKRSANCFFDMFRISEAMQTMTVRRTLVIQYYLLEYT